MAGELNVTMWRLNEVNIWLSVFPVEVWEIIVDHIIHPADMYNLTVASPLLLTDMLEPHRMTYLFYQVLKVADDPQPKPNLISYLGPKNLLKCRRVCSTWDHCVDLYLETRPCHSTVSRLFSTTSKDIPSYSHLPPNVRNDSAYHSNLRLYNISRGKIESDLLPQLNSIFYHQPNDLRCPSPTRHLVILEGRQNERIRSPSPRRPPLGPTRRFAPIPLPPPRPRDYGTLIPSILQKVGPSFWHLTIQTKHLQQLQGYLNQLPNLKSLYILSIQSKGHMSLLKPDHTLPTFNSLRKVHFELVSDAIVKLILDANRDLKVVEIRRTSVHYNDECSLWEELGMELEKQPFKDVSWPLNPAIFATSIRSSEELFVMPINWRRLSILRLDCSSYTESYANWVEIFRKLEVYQESLSELYLELPNCIQLDEKMKAWEASRKPLNLPLLNRLELTVMSFSSLDFLLGLRSLEYLRLRLGYRESKSHYLSFLDYQDEKINFDDGFGENFLECNIWKLMDHLKEVDVSIEYRPGQIYKRSELKSK